MPQLVKSGVQNPWTLERVKVAMPGAVEREKRGAKSKPEPLDLTPVLESLRGNLPAVVKSSHLSIREPESMPPWLNNAVESLPRGSSDNLAVLYRALTERAPLSLKRLIVEGPKRYNRAQRRYVSQTVTADDAKALAWCALLCADALAEKDEERAGRAIASLMMLPTSGDVVDADRAEVWLDTLADQPIWAIEAACKDHVKREKWRPTPSEINTVCEELTKIPRRIIENAKEAAKP